MNTTRNRPPVTKCPAGQAAGIEKEYSARCNKHPQPMNPKFYPATFNGTLHRVDIYWFTYTVLDPKRINRLDILTTKQFLTLLENHDGNETKTTNRTAECPA